MRLTVNPVWKSRVSEVLTLAPRTETVMVIGTVPAEPSAPDVDARARTAPAAISRARVRTTATQSVDRPCPAEIPNSVTSARYVTMRSGSSSTRRAMCRLIDGGTGSRTEVGHNYVARRTYRARHGSRPVTEHSAGVVQVVSADEQTATAVVVYACDA